MSDEPKKMLPIRRRMPDERKSITHKFDIAGYKGYLTAGEHEDGTLGEIFIKMAKQGSTVSGLVDCFSISTSIALQYGAPLKVLVEKFKGQRFEPQGITPNQKISIASSIVDYVFCWIEQKYLSKEDG